MATEDDKALEVQHNREEGRHLSLGRRLAYAVGKPLLKLLVQALWSTYRIELCTGKETVDTLVRSEQAYVPCYWHRDILVCLMTIKSWVGRGFNAGVIISPSVDGEVPSSIARGWGFKVIRGSATRTGTLAMRNMHSVMSSGTSVITAADGPVGPAYYFKSGVVMTSKIGKAPLVPIGCAADRAWYLRRWDDFMIPKPFARVAVAVGTPHSVGSGLSKEGLEAERQALQDAVNDLVLLSKKVLGLPEEQKTQ